MSDIKNDYTPEGRPVTFLAIVTAALASAAFNVWGASQVFDGIAAIPFAIGIGAVEIIALLAMKHIVADFNNRNYYKAIGGAVIFTAAVFGCGKAGYHALTLQNIEIREINRADTMRADQLQKLADQALSEGNDGKWETRQRRSDELRLEVKKNRELSPVDIFAFLILFELLKSFGRYTIAVEESKGRTWKQRRSDAKRAKPRLVSDAA